MRACKAAVRRSGTFHEQHEPCPQLTLHLLYAHPGLTYGMKTAPMSLTRALMEGSCSASRIYLGLVDGREHVRGGRVKLFAFTGLLAALGLLAVWLD